MSTRANVILQKGDDRKIWFYRHCDGYPSGLGKELEDAIDLDFSEETILNILEIPGIELTSGKHGDIEYLYTVDLNTLKMTYE